MKHIDLTGQRYGKLVVLSQLPKEGKYYRQGRKMHRYAQKY